MLKQTLAPVVLVVVLWIAMSSSTTYYLFWVERSHQRVFVENFVSIRAAETMLILVWRSVAECSDDSRPLSQFRPRWNETAIQIESEHQTFLRTAFTDDARPTLVKVNAALKDFVDDMNRVFDRRDGESGDLAAERLATIARARRVEATINELVGTIQQTTDRDARQRQHVRSVVLSARSATLLVGPLLGVFLGWRLAVRLHRSITRIAVTLHDAASNTDSNIGTVAIEATGDFRDVQQRAEQVAVRMRQVSLDLQSARREVLQSERLAAVGELAAGVAHEIRNPLTSNKLLLQHAIRQNLDATLDESKVRLILEEIGRMETTVQGLLDFSRPPKLNRVPHDLRHTLRRALNLLEARARQQGIEIELCISETPLIVDGDTEMLHQVLVNLLINAVEAMPEGGRLSIDAHLAASSTSVPQCDGVGENDRVVEIVIRDSGEGIASDVLSRLFEPFATTKERGTGLGLAVSHRIVEEHRGAILAGNVPNGGAQFTLEIPAANISEAGPKFR